MGCHQLVHHHPTALADAMDPIRGLVFASGIPPAVIMDDNRAGRQINAKPGRLKRAQKDKAVRITLEPSDLLAPLFRASANLRIAYAV